MTAVKEVKSFLKMKEDLTKKAETINQEWTKVVNQMNRISGELENLKKTNKKLTKILEAKRKNKIKESAESETGNKESSEDEEAKYSESGKTKTSEDEGMADSSKDEESETSDETDESSEDDKSKVFEERDDLSGELFMKKSTLGMVLVVVAAGAAVVGAAVAMAPSTSITTMLATLATFPWGTNNLHTKC